MPFLFAISVQAQSPPPSSLEEKFKLYSKANPTNLLFVHTDKTIYTNNETIWFCGYLVKNEARRVKDHSIMAFALMQEGGDKVPLHARYLMQEGLSFGSFTLPDSIAPGNYQLIAYTNVLDQKGDPLALFTQPLTIKSVAAQDFNAELTLLDTVATGDFVRARLTVSINDYNEKEKRKIALSYAVSKYPRKFTTLKNGEKELTITIPKSQLSQVKPVLSTSVNYKNKIHHLNLRLPEPKQGIIKVRFFPEGGNLCESLETVVALETKNFFDQPVAVTGVLFQDGRPIDTISTNSYGAGKFRLTPKGQSNYTFKISSNSYLSRDSVYTMSTVLKNNVVLHLPQAVVNDTLQLRLQSKTQKVVRVIVHDFKNIYTSFFSRVTPAGQDIALVLGEGVPKGIKTLTVVDTAGRPLAERLFFAHYDQRVNVKLNFDKASYKRKDSVHLSVKLSDIEGLPTQGVFSLAAVQGNRIEGTKFQDIESYVYLINPLGVLPQDPHNQRTGNKEYIEDILRIRGWRRYTWQDLLSINPADTIIETQSPKIVGRVRHLGKIPKKPLDVLFMRDAGIGVVTTDANGAFELTNDNALIVEGRGLFIRANAKKEELEDYSLRLENPFEAINGSLAARTEFPALGLVKSLTSKDLKLKGMSHAINLKNVTIKALDENALYKGNECGDYVCMYRILNCPNHYYAHGNRPPVKGATYIDWRDARNGHMSAKLIYQGCTGESDRGTLIGEGIYTAREFYGVNLDETGVLETQLLSTLAWKPGLVTNKDGELKTSFATGDITGTFRVVIQGVGTRDMIFGENTFTVK